jgi:hypothetical protein
MVEITAKPTSTPNPNPYGNQLMKATVVPPSSDAATPATVPTATSSNIIAANQQQSAIHNKLVLTQSGHKGGNKRSKRSKRSKSKRIKRSKSKRSKSKRSKSNRTKRSKSNRSKSKRSNRSKRGGLTTSLTPSALIANVANGNATPSPPPIPVTTVPQFSGANSASANAASVKLNHGGMTASTQATYDNTKAAPSNFRVV